MSNNDPQPQKSDRSPRQEWVSPAIVDLPRLVDLTLQTGGGIPGGGGPGGGGSTVIP